MDVLRWIGAGALLLGLFLPATELYLFGESSFIALSEVIEPGGVGAWMLLFGTVWPVAGAAYASWRRGHLSRVFVGLELLLLAYSEWTWCLIAFMGTPTIGAIVAQLGILAYSVGVVGDLRAVLRARS